MIFLISQIWLAVVLAAMFGFAIAWAVRGAMQGNLEQELAATRAARDACLTEKSRLQAMLSEASDRT